MRRMHSPPSASTRVSIRSIRPDSLTVRCSSMPSGHPPTSAPIRRTSVFRSIGCMPGTALYASSMSRTSKRAANSRSHSAPANAPMLKLLEFLQDTFPDRRRCAQSNRRCCAGYPPRTRPYGWPHSGSGIIYDCNLLTWFDGILMHLNCSTSILQIIALGHRLTRQFPLLTNRNKRFMKIIRDRNSEDKSSGFCSCDHIHFCIFKTILHGINCKL